MSQFFETADDALRGFLPPKLRDFQSHRTGANLKVWFGGEGREHYEVQFVGRAGDLHLEVGFHAEHKDQAHNDEFYVDRFRGEARAAAQLNHPNVVSVFDWGDDAGDAYIVMEWVDGPTLREVTRAEGALDAQRAAEIGAGIAGALAYAHAKGVV